MEGSPVMRHPDFFEAIPVSMGSVSLCNKKEPRTVFAWPSRAALELASTQSPRAGGLCLHMAAGTLWPS